jgi:hypothetical protein
VSFPFDLHSAAGFVLHVMPFDSLHATVCVCVNQTRPHCVNQMGKNGMAGVRHGNGMVCVNPPLLFLIGQLFKFYIPSSTHSTVKI